jgi:hypothetical protein
MPPRRSGSAGANPASAETTGAASPLHADIRAFGADAALSGSRGTGLAATSPRACKNAKNPDTIDKRRRTVAADTPPGSLPRSTGCSTPCSPSRPVRCAVMNASTSAGRTCSGGLATTVKNTFRSDAAASTVFGRHRPARNSRYTSASGTPATAASSPEPARGPARREPPTCTAGSHRHRRLNPSRVSEMTRKITGITCMSGWGPS